MPKIPSYISTAELVLPPMVEVSSPLVPMGNALASGGLLVARRAAELRDQQDKADALAAYTRFSDEERQYLQSGYAKQGVEARGLTDEGIKWYEDARKRHSEVLGPGAKAYFERILVSKRDAGLDSLARHEATQHRQYLVETAEALIENMKRDSVRYANDDVGFEGAWQLTEQGLRTLFPGKNIEAMIMKAKREAIQDRITALIDIDPNLADKLMQQYKNEIDPDKMTAYTAHLERTRKEKQMDDAYSAIKAQFGNNLESAIRALETPGFYKSLGLDVKQARELRNILHSDWNFRKAQEAEARQRNRDVALSVVLGQLMDPNADPREIRQTLWSLVQKQQLDPKDAWTINNALEEKGRQYQKTLDERTRWQNYVELSAKIANGEIADSLELLGEVVRRGLPIETHRQLQADLNDSLKDEGAINYMQAAIKEAENYATKKKNPYEQQQFINTFKHSLALNMKAAKLRRSDPEVVALGRKLLEPFPKAPGFGTAAEALRYPMTGPVETAAPMSVDTRLRIIRQLQESGAPVTERNIQAVYEQELRGGM